MLSRKIIDQSYLGFGDITRKNTADANTLGVDMQHDLGGSFLIHPEKNLQDVHHELHRGEIIIQQEDLVQRRPLQSGLGFLDSKVVVELVIRVFGHFDGGLNQCYLGGDDYTIESPSRVSKGWLAGLGKKYGCMAIPAWPVVSRIVARQEDESLLGSPWPPRACNSAVTSG